VHSGNIEGGARMLGVIARYWHDGALTPSPSAGTDETPADAASQAAIAHTPPAPHPDSANVSTLSKCPKCHGPYLHRTHRHSAFERLRSTVTRRYPVRCNACGYTAWSADPILVRLSSGREPGNPPADNPRLDDFDPD
jgi:hypothetical protein